MLALSTVLVLLALACGEGTRREGAGDALELSGRTMGTSWSLKVPAGALSEAEAQEFRREIEAGLASFSAMFSTWIETSTISRFNRSRVGTALEIEPAFADCVRTAFAIRQDSRGAFDPTVGPVVDLWGFGPGGRPRAIPSAEALAGARALIGPSVVALEEKDPLVPRLVKRKEGARLDLSAIAKGRGVDFLIGLAEARGLASVFVNIGGEIRARGEKAPGLPWRVAVERPTGGRQVALQSFALSDRAIATSGDYRNYFEEKGKRYSHTIDPRSGRPIEHALAQVSVLAASCEVADAWATALNVLGPEEGHALAVERRLAALFLVRRPDGGFEELATPAFHELVPRD